MLFLPDNLYWIQESRVPHPPSLLNSDWSSHISGAEAVSKVFYEVIDQNFNREQKNDAILKLVDENWCAEFTISLELNYFITNLN